MRYNIDFDLDWVPTLLLNVPNRGHITEFKLDGVLVCIRY